MLYVYPCNLLGAISIYKGSVLHSYLTFKISCQYSFIIDVTQAAKVLAWWKVGRVGFDTLRKSNASSWAFPILHRCPFLCLFTFFFIKILAFRFLARFAKI